MMKTMQRLVLVAFVTSLVAHAGEMAWTGRKVIPSIKTGAGPVLATFDGTLYLAHRGEKRNNLYVTTFDGTAWAPETRIPDVESRDTPALVVLGNTMHCLYVGGKSGNIYHSRYRDGHWTGEMAVPDCKSKHRPGVAALDKKLYMVHTGEKQAQLYMLTFDGVRWSPESKLAGHASRGRPTLAVVGNTLHMCYLEDKDKARTGFAIFHTMFKDGRWTQAAQIANVRSDDPPALVVHDNRLLLFRCLGKQYGYAEFDGRTWSAVREVPGQDGRDTPGVASTGGASPTLHLVYMAKDKHYMWHAQGLPK